MSVTRMLILGAVRIFQPTHGYFVRRELTSWQMAEWAHPSLPRLSQRRCPGHMSERGPTCVCHAGCVDPSMWRLVVDEQRLPQEVRQLTYEPNPKHKPVPIPGRHGSICPPDADGPTLLQQSIQFGRKRYATDGSRVYCAHQHDEARNAWHGYPIDWAVPRRL